MLRSKCDIDSLGTCFSQQTESTLTVKRLLLATLFISCGFAAGLVVAGKLQLTEETNANFLQPNTTTPLSHSIASSTQSSLESTVNNIPDFTAIAALTVPAVANISSLQIIRRPNSPFANDQFFQYFFGNSGDIFGPRNRIESSLGSGVIVSSDGYILTNNHVVTGESRQLIDQLEITVALADTRELQATVVGVDQATDLALLKINAQGLPTIPWGDSSKLLVAEWVLAIGNPFQLNQSVTLGIVSATGRANMGIATYEDFIQTDAAINPGNSGGALINQAGELVGINTAIFSRSGGYQGIGFAVPSNLVRRVMNDLISYGEVRRGSIGYVEITPLTNQLAEQLGVLNAQGVLIRAIDPNSVAYRAGLRAGDVIVAFDEKNITDPAHLSRLVQDAPADTVKTITLIRKGNELQIKVPIELPQTRQQRP